MIVMSSFSYQVRLVNQSVLDYFLVELELTAELSCLRHWLLMEDGEFAYSLSDQVSVQHE